MVETIISIETTNQVLMLMLDFMDMASPWVTPGDLASDLTTTGTTGF
jgi:hypothetical protein